MLLINLSRQVDKFCSNLDPKHYKQLVKEIFYLAKNTEQTDIKKIISHTNNVYYRKDVGEYRIIYKIEDKVLYITVAGKRNDDSVYKIFKRK